MTQDGPTPAATPPWPARLSLRARLLAVAVGLLVVALVLTGAATLTVLRGVLLDQVDANLADVATNRPLLDSLVRTDERDPGRPGAPTEYVVRVSTADGSLVLLTTSPMLGDDRGPVFEDLDLETVQRRNGLPSTVAGGGAARWRVVAVPVNVQTPQGAGPGTVAIALPLDGVDDTVQRLRNRFLLIGVVVVSACALLGWLAVRRAFRPLREVETVTTAFGEGDTSRRVQHDWPGTEVGRLGSSVNAMLDSIETTLAAREASENRMRRFVADASHELRTPLAAVRGFAELYRQGAVSRPDDVARTFSRIEGESRRMGGLVDDLLLLARLDEQRPLRFDEVDLVVLAADAVHDAGALAPDREVRLTGLHGAPTPGSARTSGDEPRLRQVLSNLVANAVRHTPEGTAVEVGVGTRSGWALWQVRDHGPGISAEDAERVFERFFRADSSRHRSGGGGSGLGLAIVAAVAHAHGGAARVVPTSGGGATFEVAVPGLVAAAPDGPDDDYARPGSDARPSSQVSPRSDAGPPQARGLE